MSKISPLICLTAFAAIVLAISAISAQEPDGVKDALNNTSLANETGDSLPGLDLNTSGADPVPSEGKTVQGSGFALGSIASSNPGYDLKSNSRSVPMYDISKYSNIRPMYDIEKFSNTLPSYNTSTRTKQGVRVDEWPFVCDIV